jgi:outer membrane protein assembly factor BamB
MLTIKYSPSGETLWKAWVEDSGWQPNSGNYEKGTAINVDSAGNVYVAGFRHGGDEAHGDQLVAAKYNSAGDRLWITGYMNPQLGFALGNISNISPVPAAQSVSSRAPNSWLVILR